MRFDYPEIAILCRAISVAKDGKYKADFEYCSDTDRITIRSCRRDESYRYADLLMHEDIWLSGPSYNPDELKACGLKLTKLLEDK